MEPNTRLLEERVLKAVHRLRELSAERDRLRNEVRDLKKKLSEAATRHPETEADAEKGSVPRGKLAAALRKAIRELREA